MFCVFFVFQAKDGIRDLVRSRGLGDVYKRQVLNLLEGAILEHNTSSNNNAGVKANMLYFPSLRWQNIERILDNNLASWMEEICLLTSRAAPVSYTHLTLPTSDLV